MKALLSLGAICLLLSLPGVLAAQKIPVPGELASATKLSPRTFSADANAPVIISPTTVAEAVERHDRNMKALWIASIVTMLAGTTADAVTSWHKQESNPLLASSDGRFGGRGIGVKAGIAAGALLPQIIFRKRKHLRVPFAIGNFGEAAIFGGVAIHNVNAPPRY